MGSRSKIMEYRKEKIRKFMRMEEEEDDELFFVILPAILEGLNDEKRPVHTSEYTGAKKMKEILEGHESWCRSEFRMEPEIFKATSNYLRREGLLRDIRGVTVEEQLGMFMFMISHNASNGRLQKAFQHSGETIHRHIKAIFDIIPALTYKIVKLPSSNQTHPKIASDPRFWPFFKNCIGAIDGTHIPITIAEEKAPPYRNRKGTLSQNVMLACDFNLNFTFISCGWEGSASDVGVLRSAITKGFHVPEGKFYLVDAGYANTPSFLAPYRGVRYHLSEFRSRRSSRRAMGKGEGSRASWNFNYEKGLADVLHDHNHEKFRGQNGWTTEGWKSIVNKFNEKFPLAAFTKIQIQEKEKELKGNYKAIRDARKKSGTGWNDSLCMINAEPQIWEGLVKDIPKVKKFRSKPFPLYDSLEKLYEGSIATGALNFTSTESTELPPSSSTQPINLDDPDVDISVNPFFANLGGQVASSGPINLDEAEHTTSSCSGQKGGGCGKKRKQSQVAGVLQEYVDFRKKQTETFVDELNGETKVMDDCSIKNCLAVLESIEELSDEEKAKATNIFKCELNREIFIYFKNPNVRLLWIKGEIAPKA